MQELLGNTDDPKLKYRYDFKNFFTTVFIDKSEGIAIQNPATSIDPISSKPPMDKEMQLFIQRELVDKDFKNISDFLIIGFSNIYATIKNGAYSIDLT